MIALRPGHYQCIDLAAANGMHDLLRVGSGFGGRNHRGPSAIRFFRALAEARLDPSGHQS